MPADQFANDARTALAGSLAAAATSLAVDDPSAFPDGVPFRIRIGAELLLVTAGGSATPTWTVERGIEGTAAADHAAGSSVVQVLTAAALAALPAAFVPPGTGPIPYSGQTAPDGWLLCNGAAVSRTTYAALWAVAQANFAANGSYAPFGGGNGSSTFSLPDLRGRVPVGTDNMGGTSANRITGSWADAIGGAAGAETHTLATGEIPSHSHPGELLVSFSGSSVGYSGAAGTRNGAIDTGFAGGGGPHNNIQPSIALNYIIKS